MRQLYVHYEGQLVCVIAEDTDGVWTMDYEHAWQQAPHAFSLSLALPLSQAAYRGRPVQAFFENLLPEGDQRRRLEMIAHLPAGDDLAFLDRFGDDCAGALTISPQLQAVPTNKPAATTEVAIDLARIEQAVHDGTPVQLELGVHHQLPSFSLAGAQAKFPCILRGSALYLPQPGHPTTHIVKLPIRAGDKLLDSVPNEYLSMRLAELCGLPVPKVELIGKNMPLFVIERFDRRLVGGQVHRLHTQDFCQALGHLSRTKYERDGGPSLRDCYQLVRREVADKARDLLLVLDWTAFNLALGNNDSHAKNLSFILSDQTLHLAPFYDLVCTAIYPQYNASFAFKLGETSTWKKVDAAEIAQTERGLGLSKGFLKARFLRLFTKLETAMKVLVVAERAGDLRRTQNKIAAEVNMRIATLRDALAR